MTLDDVTNTILGLVAAAVTWLGRAVLSNRDRLTQAEGHRAALEDRLKELSDTQLTQESVREVLEAALERRDKTAFERRQEHDRRLALEIKQTVNEEIDRMIPKIVRDVVTNTARLNRDGGKA